jgi:hypothetical protein
MKTISSIKCIALSALTTSLLLITNVSHAQVGNSCASTTKEVIARGVVFVIKTEVSSGQINPDTLLQSKAEFEDYQCLLDSVVSFNNDGNSVQPEVKNEMSVAVRSQLQKNGVSSTKNSTLAKRFKNDDALVSHIVDLAIEAPDAYLSFWYNYLYGSDFESSGICEVEEETYTQLNGIRFIPLPHQDQQRESLKTVNNDACLSDILNADQKSQLVDELLNYANHTKEIKDVVIEFLRRL